MSQDSHECYLGLGSNLNSNLANSLDNDLGDPAANIKLACDELAKSSAVDLLEVSPLYKSSAMTLEHSEEQNDYVNAVAKCMTHRPPLELLAVIKSIEQAMGRQVDAAKWSARVIDIDILFIKDVVMQTDDLTIPHPGIYLRPFVLYPWRDLAAELQLTAGKSVRDYANEVKDEWNTTLLEISSS